MKKNTRYSSALMTGVALFALGFGVTPVMAQEELDEEDEDEIEEVIVTGSRLKRSEFSTASPIQIISGELSREVGLFNAADILAASSQTTGLQIDNTFNNFVLDNGVGASTIGFRGLGADRTLILLNGKRLAPAGAGGAPTAPDLNLIPQLAIQRVEQLLDGASAVYGSDAVAGVANVILRTDVEGFEVATSFTTPETGGGEEYRASMLYGDTGDNWNFMVSAEYTRQEAYTFGDSAFFDGCDNYIFEDEDGNRLSGRRDLAPGTTPTTCRLSTTNRINIPNFGNIWRTTGTTNIGIPNFSETVLPAGFSPFLLPGTFTQVDANGDGILDDLVIDPDQNGQTEVDIQNVFFNFDQSQTALDAHLASQNELFNIYSAGSYSLEDDADTEIYGEFLYARRETDSFSPGAQIFPDVPANNPFNPCNQNQPNGANCAGFFVIPGTTIPFNFGNLGVQPILNVRGDRDRTLVGIDYWRGVGGIRGNLPALDSFMKGNWSYEAYAQYSRSVGRDTQRGIVDSRLVRSLENTFIDGNGVVRCEPNCVPVNLFADSLYQTGGGSFATQAEEDYLFRNRNFVTDVEQVLVNASIQGDLIELWNGTTVPFLVGVEYRDESINSLPGRYANRDPLFAFFVDNGAVGSRNLMEAFVETNMVLAQGESWAEELTLELSGRLTDESSFDPAGTYSIKARYAPIESITFRGTYGTSYRAPNLRERFLLATSGFSAVTDPCVVPLDARAPADPNDLNGGDLYVADQDTRIQNVLDSCRASGVDPTALGLNDGSGNGFNPLGGVEVFDGGSDLLAEETSTAWTAGVILQQPFTDTFDLTFSASYFSIDIRNGIAAPGIGFVVSDCYSNPELPNATSAFCSRIGRDGTSGQIDAIDTTFINVGIETSKGFDFDLAYRQDFEVGGETLQVTVDLNATRMEERFFQILDTSDEDVGEPTTPRWRANGIANLRYGDWRLNWQTVWIQGGQNNEPAFQDNAPPCDGLPVACRPVFYTENYDRHSVSITWSNDQYTLNAGIRNVFNNSPARVDPSGVFSVRNFPLGIAGVDITGRTFFFSANAKF